MKMNHLKTEIMQVKQESKILLFDSTNIKFIPHESFNLMEDQEQSTFTVALIIWLPTVSYIQHSQCLIIYNLLSNLLCLPTPSININSMRVRRLYSKYQNTARQMIGA